MGKLVFWLDEEENAAFPEMVQVRFHGIDIDYMTDVDRALDRMSSPHFAPSQYAAFIIDAHMPTFGDPRFRGGGAIHHSLAGVKLCEILVREHPSVWEAISHRTLIYTMLPPSDRVDAVQRFASANGAQFVHKSNDGDIFGCLRNLEWV